VTTFDSTAAPRVIIAGVRGFGAHHLANARSLEAEGRLRIIALADPAAAADGDTHEGLPVYVTLEDALAAHSADIVIVATPIDTHAGLCASAMRAGADVLLEKPPVATVADYDTLLALQHETKRAIQVGFQSLGSRALGAFADDEFGLGELVSVSATGLWTRPRSYWERARWAGRRTLDGHPVVDGVTTNPFAHAVATSLRIAGYRGADSVGLIDTDLYRANAIDADDTSVVRVTGPDRVPVTCALTLCAAPRDSEDRGATVTVTGIHGSATFSYTTDVVVADGERHEFGRDDLLRNLIDHRRDGTELIAPLEKVGAFMRVVEAVRLAPEPTVIDPRYVEWRGSDDPSDASGADAYPVIDRIDDWAARAAASGKTFAELGAPWAPRERDLVLATLTAGGDAVAEVVDGAGTIPFSSPHPYLHPVQTRGGVTLTARHPADHDWHVGLGFAVQDAGGVNFWGGRTYVTERGYERLDDHGRIVCEAVERHDDSAELRLRWLAPDGAAVLVERRRIGRPRLVEGDDRAWLLDLEVQLSPAGSEAVTLDSPGSKGRTGAGYGGLFWRMPTCRAVDVFTADAVGEAATNGSVSPWLAWSAEFLAGPGENGEATIVLLPGDDATGRDPWFVRRQDYPGIGSAVAWDRPTVVDGGGFVRRYHAVIADGRVTRDEISRFAALVGDRA
jgi:Predicted dehydrogenases and related proteins